MIFLNKIILNLIPDRLNQLDSLVRLEYEETGVRLGYLNHSESEFEGEYNCFRFLKTFEHCIG